MKRVHERALKRVFKRLKQEKTILENHPLLGLSNEEAHELDLETHCLQVKLKGRLEDLEREIEAIEILVLIHIK